MSQSPGEILPDNATVEGDDGEHSSSESTVESTPSPSVRPPQDQDVAGSGGASGVGPLGPAPGLGGAGDELEEMMSRLRLDTVLRTRLEERLIAEGRQVAGARTRGERRKYSSVFSFFGVCFVFFL